MSADVRIGPRLVPITALTNASSPYTVLASDEVLQCDVSSGVLAITLLTPVTAANRHWLDIVLIGSSDANTVTLTTPAGVIGVGGTTTWVLQGRGSWLSILPNGTDYLVKVVL